MEHGVLVIPGEGIGYPYLIIITILNYNLIISSPCEPHLIVGDVFRKRVLL